MTTILSTKGQVVLPSATRRKLGLHAGMRFECKVRGGAIVLMPESRPAARPKLGRHPRTGLPVLVAPKGAVPLTSARVRDLLADFP
jgi:AbrB family looped-hinge helix DNA binding protein